MKTGKFTKTSEDALREWTKGTERYARTYCDPNPVVRFLNWSKLKKLKQWSENEEARSVLDFGCGTGVLLPSLASEFKQVTALDLDVSVAKEVKRCFSLNNTNLVQADASLSPFRAGVFDLVLAASALEHFPNLENILIEIKRVLRSRGALLMLSPTENSFYRLGRFLFRYRKPADHYHSADAIIRSLGRHFILEKVQHLPVPLFSSLAAYTLAKARKP